MKILIDGDSCPVTGIAVQIARDNGIANLPKRNTQLDTAFADSLSDLIWAVFTEEDKRS